MIRLATPPLKTELVSLSDQILSEIAPQERPGIRQFLLTVVLFVAFISSNGAHMIALFRDGRQFDISGSTGSVALTDDLVDFKSKSHYFLFLLTLLILWRAGAKGLLKAASLWSLIVAVGSVIVVSLASFLSSSDVNLRYPSVIVSLAVAIWALQPKLEDARVFGWLGILLAVSTLIMSQIDPARAWYPASASMKAIFGSQLLSGFLPQMNVLGMTMVFLMMFIPALQHKWSRLALLLCGSTVVVLSSSRTSLIAMLILLSLMMLFYLSRRLPSLTIIFSISSFLGAFTVLIALPFFTRDDHAFTDRGGIWRTSIEALRSHWVLGYGAGAFSKEGTLYSELAGPVPHAHNLFLNFLVIGGIVALLAFLWLISAGLLNSERVFKYSGSFAPLLFIISLVVIGWTESPLRPDEFDGASWITWSGLFFCLTVRHSAPLDRMIRL